MKEADLKALRDAAQNTVLATRDVIWKHFTPLPLRQLSLR